MKIEAITNICGCHTRPMDKEGARWVMAHCPLHEAASDLLAACEKMLEEFDRLGKTTYGGWPEEDVICAVRAAIAKAKEPGR